MNRCIDAGREGCPCALAESGDCLICPRLSGLKQTRLSSQTCDDCGWQGVCIYTLYEQNGGRAAKPRKERLLEIAGIRSYSPQFKVFLLRADRGFCQKAGTAGAYVFVKSEGEEPWYGVPISILKSEPDKGLIHLGICACGPKTTRIFQCAERFEAGEKVSLSVRGIYYNALSGMQRLIPSPDRTYIFAKGIAIAPLRSFLDGGDRYTRFLKNLKVYVDLDKIGFDFFRDYFGDLPADAIKVCDFAREGLWSPKVFGREYLFSQPDIFSQPEAPGDPAIPGQPDAPDRSNIFALTSPYYADQIQRAAGRQTPIVRPNEGNMCCGEGICGACTYNDETGRIVRQCKAAR